MLLSAYVVLMLLAVIAFGLATANVPTPRVNLTAAGLFFWSLAILIGR